MTRFGLCPAPRPRVRDESPDSGVHPKEPLVTRAHRIAAGVVLSVSQAIGQIEKNWLRFATYN